MVDIKNHRGKNGRERRRCERCGRLFWVCRYNNHRHRFCDNPGCVQERAREQARKDFSRRYHSSPAMAHELNIRTTESRRNRKERERAEAAAAALAQAAMEAAVLKAETEKARAFRERQEREERRDLQLLGLQAQLFGVSEAEDMVRVSARTLEVGMKWRTSMASESCLYGTAFHVDESSQTETDPRGGISF